jgi:hypothetical protein
MTPPTYQQVFDYSRDIGYTELDVEYFILYHQQRGWNLAYSGKLAPMKDWKAVVRTWHLHEKRRQAALGIKAQAVLDEQAVSAKLRAGEHITEMEKRKIPEGKWWRLSQDAQGWYWNREK